MTARAWILCAVLACLVNAGSRPPEIPFRKHMIDPGASETLAIADINGDAVPDFVSGENISPNGGQVIV